jgi:hypothetical protein
MFETRFVWVNPRPRAAFWSLVPAAAAGPAAPVITTPAVHTAANHIDVRLVGIMTVLSAEG